MKCNASKLAAAFFLSLLCATAASAQDNGKPGFEQELSKQDQIYRSQGEKRPEGYVIDRSLAYYEDALPQAFDKALTLLGPADRWLDIGAGEGQAVLDYFAPEYESLHGFPVGAPRRKAGAVAMSIEDRRSIAWHSAAAVLPANQIRYLFGKPFQDYAAAELGTFRLITDVIGGFSYTDNLSMYMVRVLSALELNGSFYTVLQDVNSDAGTNAPHYSGAPYLTGISNATGTELKVCSWLKSISCVEVTCELRSRWKPPIEAYTVRKICNETRVPDLTPTHFQAGTPPERKFRWDR